MNIRRNRGNTIYARKSYPSSSRYERPRFLQQRQYQGSRRPQRNGYMNRRHNADNFKYSYYPASQRYDRPRNRPQQRFPISRRPLNRRDVSRGWNNRRTQSRRPHNTTRGPRNRQSFLSGTGRNVSFRDQNSIHIIDQEINQEEEDLEYAIALSRSEVETEIQGTSTDDNQMTRESQTMTDQLDDSETFVKDLMTAASPDRM